VQFHANHVSASEDGDYYQVKFEVREDAGDHESQYLIIQRQFEDPDGGVCYVETHDEKYIGHFSVRRIDLSPSRIVLEIDRPEANDCYRTTLNRLLKPSVQAVRPGIGTISSASSKRLSASSFALSVTST